MKRLSIAIFVGVLCSSVNAWAEEVIVPNLSVQGQAEIEVPADQVILRIGVQTQAKSADKALDENAKKLDSVIRALTSKGLVDKEYQTGRFSINPQWSSRPKNYTSSWVATIEGYQVINEIVIKTNQFTQVGEWLAVATEKGANQAGQLSFGLQDPDEHRQEAIRLATKRAKSYAEEAAKAAGVTLQQILSINVNNAHFQPVVRKQLMRGEMAMMSSDSVAAPTINPGDITVSASVNMSFEIQ